MINGAHTRSFNNEVPTNGVITPAKRLTAAQNPKPVLLTTVGNTSGVNTKVVEKAPIIHNLATTANIVNNHLAVGIINKNSANPQIKNIHPCVFFLPIELIKNTAAITPGNSAADVINVSM